MLREVASMIQLTFQAAFDPFHAVFRLFRLEPVLRRLGPVNRDLVRILDFYLLFPFRVNEIRLNPKHRSYKKLAATYSGAMPYGELPDSVVLFERMAAMQVAAMETLAAQEFLDASALGNDMIEVTDKQIPTDLVPRLSDLNVRQSDLMSFLEFLASEYPLTGEGGLKARTGLIEYRYYPV